MSSRPSTKEARSKLTKMYAIGIVVFSVIVGSITVLAKFVASLNMN